jgi:hypothetical protein
MEWIEWIKVLVICYVLSDLAEFLGEIVYEYDRVKNRFLKLIQMVLGYLLICSKCFSFWFSLILTGDLFISAVIGLSVDFIKNKIKNIKTKI